jgi:rhamnosyltransferase
MSSVAREGLAGATRRARVSAIVVTFNPNMVTLDAIFAALRPQVDRVVIVDNGSAAGTVSPLTSLAERYACTLEALETNLGIAAAQNRGVAVAIRDAGATTDPHCHYVLFLDHDSIPAPDMVGRLMAADVRVRAKRVRVGGVGPLIVDKRTGTDGRFVRAKKWWVGRDACTMDCSEINVDFLISSGTLCRLDVFKDIGGMNEGLFIDHVDTDWCLRATGQGYRLYGVCDARLMHTLGDDVVEVWAGRWREVFVHSPVRDYYMCRNTVLILRELSMSRAWRIFLVTRLIVSMLFFGLAVAPRWIRLSRMARGIADGLAGRDGAIVK